jgi:hypothetical protein
MNCHYCDREAVFAAESGGVKLGLCETHLRDRLGELAGTDELKNLEQRVDITLAE